LFLRLLLEETLAETVAQLGNRCAEIKFSVGLPSNLRRCSNFRAFKKWISYVAGFGNTVFEILHASCATNIKNYCKLCTNINNFFKLCTRNWMNPSPTARPSLQITMEAQTQHISTRAALQTAASDMLTLLSDFCDNLRTANVTFTITRKYCN